MRPSIFMRPILLILLLPAFLSCAQNKEANDKPENFLFDPLLADGFDFPVGNKEGKGAYTSLTNGKQYPSWYIATKNGEIYSLGIHTGEDWNGSGGGNTDLGQPVRAIGKGKVLKAAFYPPPWGNLILIEHRFLENAQLKKVYSVYAHLDTILVKAGATVSRREKIGTIGTGGGSYPAHLHLEIRKSSLAGYPADYWPSSNDKDQAWVLKHYEDPSAFIQSHRQLPIPATMAHLLVADKSDYQLQLFQNGKLKKTYPIALSQEPEGHKEEQGDNRLPEGAYYISQKSRGPFSGPVADFFGPAWMRISYPNEWDARAGKAKGLITYTQMNAIIGACEKKQMPPKNTQLGGGIGIHGWAGEWSESGDRDLTWGCISMLNSQLETFYDLVPLRTAIYIYP